MTPKKNAPASQAEANEVYKKTSTTSLRPPPPNGKDVSIFRPTWMPIRLKPTAELAERLEPAVFAAHVRLLLASWSQTPAASLPALPRVLAQWAGVTDAWWLQHGSAALSGFELCSDGRWHHLALATQAAAFVKRRQTEKAWQGRSRP